MASVLATALSQLALSHRDAGETEFEGVKRRVLVLKPGEEEMVAVELGAKTVFALTVSLREDERRKVLSLPEASRAYFRDSVLREILQGRTESQVTIDGRAEGPGNVSISLHQTVVLRRVDQAALQRVHDAIVELVVSANRCRIALGGLRALSSESPSSTSDDGMFA